MSSRWSTRESRRTSRRSSSPRSASARARCEPTKPSLPVTRVFGIAGDASGPIGRALDRTDRWAPPAETCRRSATRTRYLPDDLVAKCGDPSGQPLRQRSTASSKPEMRDRRLRRVLRAAARLATRARPPRSRRSATSSRSTSPLLDGGQRDRLDPPLGRHLRARASRRSRRRAAARSTRAATATRDRMSSTAARPAAAWACALAAAAKAAAEGATPTDVRSARRGGPRLAADVVRDRHARVPAQGRADRRRPAPGSAPR